MLLNATNVVACKLFLQLWSQLLQCQNFQSQLFSWKFSLVICLWFTELKFRWVESQLPFMRWSIYWHMGHCIVQKALVVKNIKYYSTVNFRDIKCSCLYIMHIYCLIHWQFYSNSGRSHSYVFNHSCCVDCNRVLSTMGVIHQYVLVSGVCGAYKT